MKFPQLGETGPNGLSGEFNFTESSNICNMGLLGFCLFVCFPCIVGLVYIFNWNVEYKWAYWVLLPKQDAQAIFAPCTHAGRWMAWGLYLSEPPVRGQQEKQGHPQLTAPCSCQWKHSAPHSRRKSDFTACKDAWKTCFLPWAPNTFLSRKSRKIF